MNVDFLNARCSSCMYAKETKSANIVKRYKLALKADVTYFRCLRYPPQIVKTDGGSINAYFPIVGTDTFACGEYLSATEYLASRNTQDSEILAGENLERT